MTPSSSEAFVVSRTRLEYLFDGVFAIAMTLMALELKVPEIADRHSAAELFAGLAREGWVFFSFALSFGMLGVLWYRHHQLYRHLHRPTRISLVLHLVMMATAAIFPFCAALLGRHPVNPATLPCYVGCVGLHQWSAHLVWWDARRKGALDPDLDPKDYLALGRRLTRSSAVLLALFLVMLSRAL